MLLITTEYPRVISFLEIFIKIRNKNIIFFKLILTRCIPLAIPFRENCKKKSKSPTDHGQVTSQTCFQSDSLDDPAHFNRRFFDSARLFHSAPNRASPFENSLNRILCSNPPIADGELRGNKIVHERENETRIRERKEKRKIKMKLEKKRRKDLSIRLFRSSLSLLSPEDTHDALSPHLGIAGGTASYYYRCH